MTAPSPTTQHKQALTLAQTDGGSDCHRQTHHIIATGANNNKNDNNYAQPSARSQAPLRTHNVPTAPRPPQRLHTQPIGNTVRDLLPYCTTEPPLNEAQVIALSDVVGSLKELVLLALAAASGNVESTRRLECAVGGQAAANIVEFFVDEWEIEG